MWDQRVDLIAAGTVPARHHQLLRGPDGPPMRWWRPLVSLIVGLLSLVACSVVLVVALRGWGAIDPAVHADDHPATELFVNLWLASLIPVTIVATRAGYGPRPMRLASVTGRLRRRWLAWCLAASGATVLLLLAVELVIGLALGTPGTAAGSSPEPHWPVLLVIILVTTPLQAAGEEFLCRGWLSQLVGSMFRGRLAGAVASGGGSSLAFTLLHGEQNVWLFADRFTFGVLAWWLVWRTGGLEAGIALHTVWNLAVVLPALASGGLAETTGTSESLAAMLFADVVTLLMTLAVLLAARHRRPQELRTPAPAGALTPGQSGQVPPLPPRASVGFVL